PKRTCCNTWSALSTLASGFTSGANGRTMSANTPNCPTFSSTVIRAIRVSMRSAAMRSLRKRLHGRQF
ncbi:hypothetical protein BRN55_00905, partial [Xanthomonas oryzae pv. oryzae]